ADLPLVARGAGAVRARILLGDVVAGRAVRHALLDVADRVAQPLRIVARVLEDVEREPLRAFRADARELLQLLDEAGERIGQQLETGNLEPAHQAGHLLRELLVDLAVRVVDRREDQVLQHLHVVFGDDFRIDLDRLELLVAADGHGDHAAAGGRLDAQLGHLLLQALLHLLRLLHHRLNVHIAPTDPYISSTSRISAGKTSSIACTVDEDIASAFKSRFRSFGSFGAFGSFGPFAFAAFGPFDG